MSLTSVLIMLTQRGESAESAALCVRMSVSAYLRLNTCAVPTACFYKHAKSAGDKQPDIQKREALNIIQGINNKSNVP